MDGRLGLLVVLVGCAGEGTCEVSGSTFGTTVDGTSCSVQYEGCAGAPSYREVACEADGTCGCTPEGSGPGVDAATFCLVVEGAANGADVDEDLVTLATEGCGW